MNLFNIKNTFKLKYIKNWDTIYILIDVHGVIIPNSLHGNVYTFICNDCIEVLQWFSKRKDICIILWTSSYSGEIAALIDWLAMYAIDIDYVNHNPQEKNTDKADFTYKPYYNILLDDKAGLEPLTDWAEIKKQLIDIGEWSKVIFS